MKAIISAKQINKSTNQQINNHLSVHSSQFTVHKNQINKSTNQQINILIDAALLGVALLLPTLSHLVALPVYQLNPMLLLLMIGVGCVKNRYNSWLLALLLPLASYFLVGMPSLTKALCMVAEFSAVVTILPMLRCRMSDFPAVLLSVLCAKVVYYGIKTLLLGSLMVDTSLWMQLLSVVLASLLFTAITAKTQR